MNWSIYIACIIYKMRSAKWFKAFLQLTPCFCTHVVVIAIMDSPGGKRAVLNPRVERARKDGLPPKPES